jgi:HEPN domain-containing protein
MDEAKRQLVKNWLIRAQRDLETARKLSSAPDPILDTAIYHCQQAAEKAITGFLVLHDQRFEKTHDLEVLITQAVRINAGFTSWIEAGENLTPYVTAFRYPGDVLEPDPDEFGRALSAAEDFLTFVKALLPPDVAP